MQYTQEKLPKKVTAINVTFAWTEVKQTFDKMLEEVIEHAEIKGFRKGKAPRDLVEKNLDRKIFLDEVFSSLIKESYPGIVKELDLKPISMPRIEISAQEENKDWVYRVIICETPEIELGAYKEEVAKLHAREKIWIPGKDDKKHEEEDKNAKANKNLSRILEVANVDLSEVLIEEEANKLLAELLEEIKKLGLNLQQYLSSTGKTAEMLKEEYQKKAQDSLRLEFVLSKLADLENINVGKEEIDKVISEVKDDNYREQLKNSTYQLAALLRRQKTLDFIANL